jgi:glyceraldehyde 3-phosphate dehydrogenase
MTIKVGINGFGRIGRMVFRAIDKDFDNLEVVGINDLLDNDYLAYMLRYDSVHGRFGRDVEVEGNNFVIDGKKIRLTAERNPSDLKWGELGADRLYWLLLDRRRLPSSYRCRGYKSNPISSI